MRLDKYFSSQGILSRTETARALKQKRIAVNGNVNVKTDTKIDENIDNITLDNEKIEYTKFIYIMMNKPLGIVSATEDSRQKTVIDLLPSEYAKLSLFPCGRLDKDTEGLIILTNDGDSAHKRLAPKSHVKKLYQFECAEPLSSTDICTIEQGIELKDGTLTKPCQLKQETPLTGEITLIEGKYHEIRRLFGAIGNKIVALKRVSFGNIKLDPSLDYGEWRFLTDEEKADFTK